MAMRSVQARSLGILLNDVPQALDRLPWDVGRADWVSAQSLFSEGLL
jgi:hypothetical protein